MAVEVKTLAPDFELKDENGATRHLSDYRGKPVVLYFYPKDETPGCTTEACAFRDDYAEYEKAGVTILGVSPDSPQSHTKFRNKYHLPFDLLSDEGHHVAESYGVWGMRKIAGRELGGNRRTTFLIARDGTITKVFENVQPAGHSKEVLEALVS
jgi:peroxiredoxin Q/BCP